MITWWVWLLGAAVTVRLTRLIAVDTFPPAAWFRATVREQLTVKHPDGSIAEDGADHAGYQLITCSWCASWWLGVAVYAACFWPFSMLRVDGYDSAVWLLWPASALAWSLLTGLLLGWGGEGE